MAELDEFEFDADREQSTGGRLASGGGGGLWLWIIAALVAVGLAAGVFWGLRLRGRVPLPTATVSPSTPSPPPSPSSTPAIALPALDQSDATVRGLAAGLSKQPLFAAWLAQSNLMRRFVATVVNVVEGVSPRPHLGFLAVKGDFKVKRDRGRIAIDPASYARYDAIADVFESLDTAACVSVYRTLLPVGEEAYRELGRPQGDLTTAVQTALRHLLDARAPQSPAVLRPALNGSRQLYAYADAKLEALSPAQKHLLRMGPRNVGRVQAKLKEFLDALGPAPSR